MKTPREVLLARHQAAEAKLDKIRFEAVRAAANMNRGRPPIREFTFAAAIIRSVALLYRELVLPCRRTWAALAAVWLVILGFRIGSAEGSNVAAVARPVSTEELRLALEQRRALLAELAQLPQTETTEPAKPDDQPRSERRATSACA